MAGDKPESSTKEDGRAVDTNSPYYIHASEYPRHMQVNDALTCNNYNDWAQEMKNFLFAKNKIGFINGTIEKPEEGSLTYMIWMRADAMIKCWLTTTMEKDIRSSVKSTSTAREIWAYLQERFGKESAPRVYELKQPFTITRQDEVSVSAYYTKMRGIWDEIQTVSPVLCCTCSNCTCNIGKRLIKSKEKEKLYEFIMRLDNEYSTIKT